jgi:carbamate kinase
MTLEVQRKNIQEASKALAAIVLAGHTLIVTHGNGPQIGLLALQAASGPRDGAAYPLDVLGAETDGMIGYIIGQELYNCLPAGSRIATLLTQIRVDATSPAFANPTKPIGPLYDQPEADRLAKERNWKMGRDGQKWRRVVPSPEPLEILEAPIIELLVSNGIVTICTGGGGIPVARNDSGKLVGIDAVIDKDRASAFLAEQLGADLLLLLTDVDAVFLDFGTPVARAVRRAGPKSFDVEGFPSGSMGPKIEAAANFVAKSGKRAVIGRLEDGLKMVAGSAGTEFVLNHEGLQFSDCDRPHAVRRD